MAMMSERERTYIEMCARDMHPDLYADVKEPREVKALRDRYNAVDQLRFLAKLYTLPDWPQPSPYTFGSRHIFATVYDYTLPKPHVDNSASLRELRKYTQLLKREGAKITKDYRDSAIDIKATFDNGLVIVVSADRGVICEKKVVGQEWVEPAKGYYKEVVEWDCAPVSILKSGDD